MALEDPFEGSLSLVSQSESNALAAIPTCRGVLLFTDTQNQPVRFTYCANLRRTVQAKLFSDSEEPSRRADIAHVTEQIYYLPCRTEYESFRQYIHLAHRLFPASFDDYISLPSPRCVCADPMQLWGAFNCSDQPLQNKSAAWFGLFPSRKAADAFAQAWNTVFGLCRNRRLALAGKGKQCSYYQMGLCPGPCLDHANEAMYRRTVEQAVEAASRTVNQTINLIRIQMKQKAANMEFEQAQLLKKQMEELEQLEGSAYQWTSNLQDLNIIHIDKSCFSRKQGRKKIPAFCIYEINTRQTILLKEIFISKETEEPNEETMPIEALELPVLKISEHLGLLSYYLYRSSPPGIWMSKSRFLCMDEKDLERLITKIFLEKKSNDKAAE